MALVWGLFGIFIGMTSAPRGQGVIPVISFAVAGLIVMPGLGVVLGLLGGKVKEVVIGGVLGGVGGMSLGVVSGRLDPALLANMGLISGGIAGATVATLIHSARWVGARQLLAEQHS